MTDNRTTELYDILDEFEHECFMLRVEASETRARDDVVRKSYERIRNEFAGRIAALGSDRESELLTAEQVREAIFNSSSYASYDGARYYADGIGMQAIADELNTRAERTCRIVMDGPLGKCSACGDECFGDAHAARCCPNCGRRVER